MFLDLANLLIILSTLSLLLLLILLFLIKIAIKIKFFNDLIREFLEY